MKYSLLLLAGLALPAATLAQDPHAAHVHPHDAAGRVGGGGVRGGGRGDGRRGQHAAGHERETAADGGEAMRDAQENQNSSVRGHQPGDYPTPPAPRTPVPVAFTRSSDLMFV